VICYKNSKLGINLTVNSKMHDPDYECGMFMIKIKCVRCKKKIKNEPTYVGSPPRPYCKNCAGKVTE